jgi:hypothetical protein
MTMTRILAKCELCFAETGSDEYNVGLSHIDIDHDYSNFEHKHLCRKCFLKVKLFILEQIRDNFGPRLESISENMQAARLKMG